MATEDNVEPLAGVVRTSDQGLVAIQNEIAATNIPENVNTPVTIQPFDWLDSIKPSFIDQKTWSFIKGSIMAGGVAVTVWGYEAWKAGTLSLDTASVAFAAGVFLNAVKKYILDNS